MGCSSLKCPWFLAKRENECHPSQNVLWKLLIVLPVMYCIRIYVPNPHVTRKTCVSVSLRFSSSFHSTYRFFSYSGFSSLKETKKDLQLIGKSNCTALRGEKSAPWNSGNDRPLLFWCGGAVTLMHRGVSLSLLISVSVELMRLCVTPAWKFSKMFPQLPEVILHIWEAFFMMFKVWSYIGLRLLETWLNSVFVGLAHKSR